MLSNCRAETDLHNQTIGGKMGHVGKQLVLSPLACFGTVCPHMLYFLTDELSMHRCRCLSYKCCLFLEMSVMCTCFLRAELICYFVTAAQVTGTNQ